jgi:hypothetical protein
MRFIRGSWSLTSGREQARPRQLLLHLRKTCRGQLITRVISPKHRVQRGGGGPPRGCTVRPCRLQHKRFGICFPRSQAFAWHTHNRRPPPSSDLSFPRTTDVAADAESPSDAHASAQRRSRLVAGSRRVSHSSPRGEGRGEGWEHHRPFPICPKPPLCSSDRFRHSPFRFARLRGSGVEVASGGRGFPPFGTATPPLTPHPGSLPVEGRGSREASPSPCESPPPR